MNHKILTLGSFLLFALNLGPAVYAQDADTAAQDKAFEKEMSEFYEKEKAQHQRLSEQHMGLFKQLESLQGAFSATNPEQNKAPQAQIAEIQKQLQALVEEMTRNEVKSAEFNLKVAEHRLAKARRSLSALEERQKNQKKFSFPKTQTVKKKEI